MRSLVVILLLVARPALAAGIDAQQQALLFLRILAGDHNLKQRASEQKVTVGVVYGAADEDAATDLVLALERIAKKSTVGGLPLVPLGILFDKSFDNQAAKLVGLFVFPSIGDALPNVLRFAQKHSILTATSAEALVQHGADVGFVLKNDHLVLLVNEKASKESGVQFDPSVLKLAEIVQ